MTDLAQGAVVTLLVILILVLVVGLGMAIAFVSTSWSAFKALMTTFQNVKAQRLDGVVTFSVDAIETPIVVTSRGNSPNFKRLPSSPEELQKMSEVGGRRTDGE